jgi:hypothetical protein
MFLLIVQNVISLYCEYPVNLKINIFQYINYVGEKLISQTNAI